MKSKKEKKIDTENTPLKRERELSYDIPQSRLQKMYIDKKKTSLDFNEVFLIALVHLSIKGHIGPSCKRLALFFTQIYICKRGRAKGFREVPIVYVLGGMFGVPIVSKVQYFKRFRG